MASMFGVSEMNALQDLCRDDEDTALRPAQSAVVQRIGPNAVADDGGEDKENAPAPRDPKAIWADDEIPPEEALNFVDAADDKRKRAAFEMLYKQDVYLGTEKNPSSAHSNAIVYKIKFPGHAHSELDVDVTKTTLSASSDRLKLALYLPQPVHADRGSAKWDDKKKVLTIELPVDVDEW
ncbi:PIH1 domain-containing protein [Aureococcus anophagefferens]|uniref:PIH1 domain-containing protein n=2 Tax=Aureococcus anophagefferens TaxID=44056 RepID=A0ABR1G7U5_AURAN|nr:hypothetical protein JL720_9065 [Aureococcus anophagefferens]